MPTATFTLTLAEVNLLLEALAELPLKKSANLYTTLKTQAEAQMNSAPTAP